MLSSGFTVTLLHADSATAILKQSRFQRQADMQLLLLYRSSAPTCRNKSHSSRDQYRYTGMITLCDYSGSLHSPKLGTDLLLFL